MNKDWKNHLKKIGSLGGKATLKKHGKKHYQKMVQIREKNKTQKLSTFKSLDAWHIYHARYRIDVREATDREVVLYLLTITTATHGRLQGLTFASPF